MVVGRGTNEGYADDNILRPQTGWKPRLFIYRPYRAVFYWGGSMPANRTKQGQFKEGQSGNPDGRPKVAKAFREECRKFMAEEGWEYLFKLARQEGREQKPAVELIAAYAYGKPKQGVELSGEDGNDIKIIIERI